MPHDIQPDPAAPTVAEIERRVNESRQLRSDAGYEAIAVTGSANTTGAVTVNSRFPLLAKSMQYEHHHVRWANAALLSLTSQLAASLRETQRLAAEVFVLREERAQVRDAVTRVEAEEFAKRNFDVARRIREALASHAAELAR